MSQLYILGIFKNSWATQVIVNCWDSVLLASFLVKIEAKIIDSQGVDPMSKHSSSIFGQVQGFKELLATILEL